MTNVFFKKYFCYQDLKQLIKNNSNIGEIK